MEITSIMKPFILKDMNNKSWIYSILKKKKLNVFNLIFFILKKQLVLSKKKKKKSNTQEQNKKHSNNLLVGTKQHDFSQIYIFVLRRNFSQN